MDGDAMRYRCSVYGGAKSIKGAYMHACMHHLDNHSHLQTLHQRHRGLSL